MKIITECAICKSTHFVPNLTCMDYTVSKEDFNIVRCGQCGFHFTNPLPSLERLGDYYKSEEYISHSNTNKGLISKLYHLVRNYTLKGKLRLVSRYVSRGTILDYGCGTGMFLNTCKVAGWQSIGIEPDAGARKIATEMGLEVFENKERLFAEKDKIRFDAISLWHVLEHVPDLNETIQLLLAHLKEGGSLFVAVPNHRSEDAQHYQRYWAAYDVPRHLYHFDRESMQSLMSKHGLRLTETLPMRFDSYYVSMLSEKYKNGGISYFKAFISGFRSNWKARSSGEYSSLIYVFKR